MNSASKSPARAFFCALLLVTVFPASLTLALAVPPRTPAPPSARTPAPPSAKEIGVLVANTAVIVDAAARAEVRVKAALTAVEKAKPAALKTATDNLQKAKAALENARKDSRARLDAAAPYMALDLIPKAEMEKHRKRVAELNAKLAAIPVY